MERSRPRRLTRSTDRILGGVASGLGEYVEVDPTIVRVAWVLAVVFGLPLAVIGYFILWIIMPGPDEARRDQTEAQSASAGEGSRRDNTVLILGIVLIVVGALFLLPDFDLLPWFGWRLIHVAWPVLLIIGGLLLLTRSGRTNT